MQSIDVRDLPEQVAKAIAAMVQTIREQAVSRINDVGPRETFTLPKWDGQVIGSLKRSEIYDDAR